MSRMLRSRLPQPRTLSLEDRLEILCNILVSELEGNVPSADIEGRIHSTLDSVIEDSVLNVECLFHGSGGRGHRRGVSTILGNVLILPDGFAGLRLWMVMVMVEQCTRGKSS